MGVKYRCNQCYFKATQHHHIMSHIRSIHEDPKHSNNEASEEHFLRKQQQSNTVDKYSCDQFDGKKATEQFQLKISDIGQIMRW